MICNCYDSPMSNTYKEATRIDTQACQSQPLCSQPMAFVLKCKLTRRLLLSGMCEDSRGGLHAEPAKSEECAPREAAIT